MSSYVYTGSPADVYAPNPGLESVLGALELR